VALIRRSFSVGPLGCNCTIVACPETREALVIDPGDEAPRVLEALAAEGVTAVKIVHTHAHFDHIMGTGEVAARTGADVLLHHDDRWLYDNAVMQTQLFGLARPAITPAAANARADAATRRSRPPPRGPRHSHARHTPGSICLYFEESGEPRCCSPATRCSRGRSAARTCGVARLPAIQHYPGPAVDASGRHAGRPRGTGPKPPSPRAEENNPFVGRFAR
jgi:glyoxylase-like metal-dependent hydrolase (beta-lactamase superfamily II)